MVKAIVIGGADCVWRDLEQVPMAWPDMVVCVNDIGMYFPGPIHHWVTLHAEKLAAWRAVRRVNGYEGGEDAYEVWTRKPGTDMGERWLGARQIPHERGSSAYLAVNVARLNGATEIVLAGCPMEPTPHFWGHTPWDGCAAHQSEWLALKHDGEVDDVTALSGWMAHLIGTPEL